MASLEFHNLKARPLFSQAHYFITVQFPAFRQSGEILSFLRLTVHTRIDCPLSTGAIITELVWDCATVTIRGAVTARPTCSSSVPSHFAHAHIWWKQLCAINYEPNVALPSKFCPRTHQLLRGRREISPQAFRQYNWRRIPKSCDSGDSLNGGGGGGGGYYSKNSGI